MHKISIIIVTYNSQVHIEDCLKSVITYADIPLNEIELVIVDNSDDKNAEETRKLIAQSAPNKTISIQYIRNAGNFGYGQANNVGVLASKGEIICIMNPDVRFTEPLLKDVLQKFSDQSLGLLGYKQIGGFNYSFYIKPECRNRFFGFITKAFNNLDIFLPNCFYLSGALFFTDRKKFVEAGMFDEQIFMYYEEPDIANRLQALGYQIKYDNSKRYNHLVGERVGWCETNFKREMDSVFYYLEKFKLDSAKYMKTMLSELQIKLAFAKLLNDNLRKDSFQKEIQMRKAILLDGQKK